FAANNVMEEQFQQLVDMGFTAEMEQILDDIAAGERKPTTYLRSFYHGESGLEPRVRQALDAIDARKVSTVTSPKWDGLVVRVGKYGPYVEGQVGGETLTASLPDGLVPADVTKAQLEELLAAGQAEDEVVGIHPE